MFGIHQSEPGLLHPQGMPSKRRTEPTEHEQTFPSTTWEWKHVIVRTPPGGDRRSVPKGLRRFYGLPVRNPRERIHLQVQYRGGSVAWVLVKARGREAWFTGDTALIDVVMEISQHRP